MPWIAARDARPRCALSAIGRSLPREARKAGRSAICHKNARMRRDSVAA